MVILQFAGETEETFNKGLKEITNVKTFASRRLSHTNLRSITSKKVGQMVMVRRVTL